MFLIKIFHKILFSLYLFHFSKTSLFQPRVEKSTHSNKIIKVFEAYRILNFQGRHNIKQKKPIERLIFAKIFTRYHLNKESFHESYCSPEHGKLISKSVTITVVADSKKWGQGKSPYINIDFFSLFEDFINSNETTKYPNPKDIKKTGAPIDSLYNLPNFLKKTSMEKKNSLEVDLLNTCLEKPVLLISQLDGWTNQDKIKEQLFPGKNAVFLPFFELRLHITSRIEIKRRTRAPSPWFRLFFIDVNPLESSTQYYYSGPLIGGESRQPLTEFLVDEDFSNLESSEISGGFFSFKVVGKYSEVKKEDLRKLLNNLHECSKICVLYNQFEILRVWRLRTGTVLSEGVVAKENSMGYSEFWLSRLAGGNLILLLFFISLTFMINSRKNKKKSSW